MGSSLIRTQCSVKIHLAHKDCDGCHQLKDLLFASAPSRLAATRALLDRALTVMEAADHRDMTLAAAQIRSAANEAGT